MAPIAIAHCLWCSRCDFFFIAVSFLSVRFEPQPHKNTIGYWAVASDSVSWPIQISKPGPFNVGLLQGAGEKGGGTARISLLANDAVVDSFEFDVEVTGHFQNFRWKHLHSR